VDIEISSVSDGTKQKEKKKNEKKDKNAIPSP
jgi:hypothetical protein